MGKNVTRLIAQFQPNNYILHLRLNRETMTFTGSVTISGQKVGRPSGRLTFHQKELTITKADITKHDRHGEHAVKVERLNHHRSFDEVRLHTSELLYPGKYTVTLEFKGKITRPMNGIYPSFFTHKGKEKKIISTQFESHHAREAFPCIDEPEAKATFDLTLTTPAKETVIANTPVKKQTEKNGIFTTTFETTPKMSTYLLAFAFGELGYKEATTKDGVVVRTYATPDNVKFTDFALDTAVKVLEFYNDYFALPYPLKKCDMIALPDFASGAMENWGCITYREQCMLVDPANTSLPNKQYVAMVVAHELAHQWFGNLVTMRWWTDLWLNEGFASWIEFLAVNHLFPEWEMWTQFATDEQQQALKLDALEHTHPVEVEVRHPDEIRTIFDTISYSKGASVIHMLHEYLGSESFRDGLRFYLDKHKYDNTDTIDLWAALEEVSGMPVKDFMHAWTAQAGFPILHATVDESEVQLKQERFYLNPGSRKQKKDATVWPIALQAETPELESTLESRNESYRVSNTGQIKLNKGQSGFYRVSYNASHLHGLATAIQRGRIKPLDRLGLLSDVFESAKAGYIDTVDALSFLEVFADEDNAAVWEVISSSIGTLRMVMDDEGLREATKPYVRKLVSKQVARLGWHRKKGESHFDSLLRPTVLGMASAADDEKVVKEALRMFKAMHEPEDVDPDLRAVATETQVKRGEIDPDLRGVVYGTAVRRGGKAEFDKLLEMHNTTTHSEERTTIAAALTGFKQPELIQRALKLIDSEHVRLQDVGYWVAYSFLNRYAKKATWEWMVKHWKWLEQNLGTDLSFYRLPIYASRPFSDEKFLKEFKDFFVPIITPAFERSVHQGIEIIEWQTAWRNRDLQEIKAYFKNKQSL